MPKNAKPAPKPPAPKPLTLRAAVPIATGAQGWTGAPVEPGGTLTTTDAALHARLVALAYGADTTA